MKPQFKKISVSTMWKSSKEHLYHGNRPKFKTDSLKRQRQKDIGQMGHRRFSNRNHQIKSREIMQELFLQDVLQREILPNFTISRFLNVHTPPTVTTLAQINRTSEYSSLKSIGVSENPFSSVGEDPTSCSDSVRSSHFLSSLGTHSLSSAPLEFISQQDSEDLDAPGAYGGTNSSEFGGNQVGRVLISYEREASIRDLLESISLSLPLLSFPSSNACNSELSCKDTEGSGILISLYNESGALGTGATSESDPQIEPRSASAQSVGISELNIFETNEGISFQASDRLELFSYIESSLASISSVPSFEDYGEFLENPAGLPLNGHLSDPCRNSPVDELFVSPETTDQLLTEEVGNVHHDSQELPMSLPCHQTVGSQSLVAMSDQPHLSGQQTSPFRVADDREEFLSASLHAEKTEEETEGGTYEGQTYVLQASSSAGDPESLQEIFHTQGLDVVRPESTLHHVNGEVQAALSPALIHNGSHLGSLDWDQMPEIEEAHQMAAEEEAHLLAAEEETNELIPVLLTPSPPRRGQQESDQVQADDLDLSLLNLGPPHPVFLGIPLQDDVDVNDIDIDLRLMRINGHQR